MRARWELDRIEEERRAMEEQRKKLEFGLVEILALFVIIESVISNELYILCCFVGVFYCVSTARL